MAQFGRSEDIHEIKVCYKSVAEICNKSGGFQSLLEVNDKTHHHEADWEEFQGTCYKNEVRHGKVIGITGSRVHVSTNYIMKHHLVWTVHSELILISQSQGLL